MDVTRPKLIEWQQEFIKKNICRDLYIPKMYFRIIDDRGRCRLSKKILNFHKER